VKKIIIFSLNYVKIWKLFQRLSEFFNKTFETRLKLKKMVDTSCKKEKETLPEEKRAGFESQLANALQNKWSKQDAIIGILAQDIGD
jgi:hypothetical protein